MRYHYHILNYNSSSGEVTLREIIKEDTIVNKFNHDILVITRRIMSKFLFIEQIGELTSTEFLMLIDSHNAHNIADGLLNDNVFRKYYLIVKKGYIRKNAICKILIQQ